MAIAAAWSNRTGRLGAGVDVGVCVDLGVVARGRDGVVARGLGMAEVVVAPVGTSSPALSVHAQPSSSNATTPASLRMPQ
ncbi:MAG: hypothetical protein ACRDP9_28955 [Kribbellaceae bacterium]